MVTPMPGRCGRIPNRTGPCPGAAAGSQTGLAFAGGAVSKQIAIASCNVQCACVCCCIHCICNGSAVASIAFAMDAVASIANAMDAVASIANAMDLKNVKNRRFLTHIFCYCIHCKRNGCNSIHCKRNGCNGRSIAHAMDAIAVCDGVVGWITMCWFALEYV